VTTRMVLGNWKRQLPPQCHCEKERWSIRAWRA